MKVSDFENIFSKMEWDVVDVKDFNFEDYLISANVILITDVKLLKSLTHSFFF